MNTSIREIDDLKAKIQSFRVSDLQSLVASFGRSRNGKKQDLQNRALEILLKHPSDVDMLAFKRKIYELFRIAQDEAKQTHYDFQPQQRVMNQPGNTYMAPGPYTLPPQTRPVGNPIIYQNGGIVSGNGYHNTGVYPGPMNVPSIQQQQQQQPPSILAPNLGDTVRIISSPISYTNVKFKSLPFYRIKHELLKPTILKLKTNGRNNATQIFQVSFLLTCDMASEIAMHRDYTKNEFNVQAQLRICAIDNSNNQVSEYDDFLPLGLYVRMNEKQCALPPCSPSVRPNVEARRIPLPINVTQFLKLSPMNANRLTINWTPEVGRTFVASVNVVEKLSSNYLLNRLKEKPPISVDVTKSIIAKQYKRVIDDDDDNDDADDDDIATTIVRVSLQCPLAKFRMMYPAKGKNCGHLQCFDGFAYISCNEKKSVWMCPVCNRSLHYDDVLIDQYFVDVLASKESSDCQEVQLFVDGSWKIYEEEVTDLTEKENPKNSGPDSPCENLSLASSEELFGQTGDQKHVVSDNLVSTSGISASVPDSFVDLTSDDEDGQGQTDPRSSIEDERTESPSSTNTSAVATVSAESEVIAENTSSPTIFSLSTPVMSPAASPAPHESAQSTSCLTTPVISPASSPRSNLSAAPSQSVTSDEAGTQPNVTKNPMVLSATPSPYPPASPSSNRSASPSPNPSTSPSPNRSTSPKNALPTPTIPSTISLASPADSHSNPMILSPSVSPTSRTGDDEVNEDAMETLRIDLSPDGTSEDVTMNEVCESIRNPDEENTLPEIPLSSIDLDDDVSMEEESSLSTERVETSHAINTPETENTNGSSTPSLLSWENAPSPTPSEIANLNFGN